MRTYYVEVDLFTSVLRLKVQADTQEGAVQIVKETKLIEVANHFEASETDFRTRLYSKTKEKV